LGLVLDELKKKEETIEVNGIELLIAEHVLPFTKGYQIDYITNSHGQGFAILPVAGNSC